MLVAFPASDKSPPKRWEKMRWPAFSQVLALCRRADWPRAGRGPVVTPGWLWLGRMWLVSRCEGAPVLTAAELCSARDAT